VVEFLGMFFDWDEDKEIINEKKHGITFDEAITVFDDDDALYKSDDAHSDYEERFIVLGVSDQSNILMVCHCYRDNDSVIRIISAREATRSERVQYRRQ